MDCILPGSLSTEFSRQQYCSRLPSPSPGDLPTQGSNPDLPHCRQILYQLSHQGWRLISVSCLIPLSACWISFISNGSFMNNYSWEKSFQKLWKLSTFKKIWWFSRRVMSNSCNPKDCSLPGSSVHGILQAKKLEWVAISFSRGYSWPRRSNLGLCTAGRFFTTWAMREAWI